MVHATYHLTNALHHLDPQLIINVGIAGSYDAAIQKGECVIVAKDCFADIGIDDNSNFRTAFQENLIKANEFPYTDGWLHCTVPNYEILKQYRTVSAITVNTVNGSETRIKNVIEKFNPQIETMESAAVLFVALQRHIPCILLRSISNRVEPRHKANWEIEKAVFSLNLSLDKILVHICNK